MTQQFRSSRLRHLVLASCAVLALAACDEASSNILPPIDGAVTLTPQAVTMLPQQTVQLSVAVTGVENPQITYTSSSTAVATVTPAGLVTAVAPGLATITASVAGRANLSASTVVTVNPRDGEQPGDPGSLTLSSIVAPDGRAVAPDSVAGTVVARFNVQWGSATRLVVSLGGRTVCEASPTGGAMATAASALNLAAAEVVCEINTARFELQGAAAVPTFPNGARELVAQLVTADGTVTTTTAARLELRNEDGFALRISAPDSASAVDGRTWVSGALTVEVIPVVYGADPVRAVTVDLRTPAGASPALSAELAPRAAAVASGSATVTYPASAAPEAGGLAGVVAVLRPVVLASATEAGASGPTRILGITGTPGTVRDGAILYDAAPPTPGTFVLATPSTARWVGGGYRFAAGKAGEADAVGVGGVTVRFVVLPAMEAAGLTAVQIAERGTAVVTADSVPTSSTNEAFVAVAAVSDALGNTSYVRLSNDAGEAIRFGVDRAGPALSLSAQSPPEGATNPTEPLTFQIADAESGFGAEPLLLRAIRVAASGTGCAFGSGTACEPAPSGAVFPVPTSDGYYLVTAVARDRAGNRSEPVTRLVLRDAVLPQVTGLTLSGTLAGGQPTALEAVVADNVELATAEFRFVYPGLGGGAGAAIPFEPRRELGDFGPERLDTTARVSHTAPFVRAIYVTDSGGRYSSTVASLASVARFRAADQAGLLATREITLATGTGGSPDGVADLGGETGPFLLSGPAEAVSLCNGGATCTARGVPRTRTLQATISGPAGQFNNPFQRVYFFRADRNGAVRLVGSTSKGSLATSTTSGNVWTYSLVFDASGIPAQDSVPLFVIGVDKEGDGLRSPDNMRLSIVD